MLPNSVLRRLGKIGVLFACLLLAGCNKSKVTQENYDKITTGMTLEEVEAILGPGSQVGDGQGVANQFGVDVSGGNMRPSSLVQYIWESGGKSITVAFRQEKVAGKSKVGL
jgi:uncharacterized lipoprotein YajG